MSSLAALSLLLAALSEAHADLGALYAELSAGINPSSIDGDVLVVARAIQGEEAGLFGSRRDELGEWIVHVAANRWAQPWWKQIDGLPCTFGARVEHDWHGTALVDSGEVEPWAVEIAYRVLEERRNGGKDQAQGTLFAMTLDDLRRHGWAERGREVLVHVIAAPDDPLVQFWMMSEDPAQEASEEER